jgi:hypothetical protein
MKQIRICFVRHELNLFGVKICDHNMKQTMDLQNKSLFVGSRNLPTETVVVILLAIKVNFSKIFLAFLLVTSCIKVGKYDTDGQERAFLKQKKCQLQNINSVLVEKCFTFIEEQRRRKWTSTKRNRKKREEQKVGPFLISFEKGKICWIGINTSYIIFKEHVLILVVEHLRKVK